MLRNQLYYRVKPLIPHSVRIQLRRWFVLCKLKRVGNIWPINPGSERPPEGWSGWPDGKKAAVVLTHDVEGAEGMDKCRQLMQLEMELGFRSSFNFVPEGSYTVSRKLREELVQNGFEVGVHDLHHDGRLYSTRKGFQEKAKRINHYMKDWGAGGFRGAFMFHNLDWLHQLDVQHDSSTFDTDPFEPHPDCVNTIFPFWVSPTATANSQPEQSGQSRRGYVELPYTLPQDSTLFLLLRERTIDIWQKKLKWVAEHGGMALVNVHPDYLCFENERPSFAKYPVAYYRQFLEHIRDHYNGTCWHPLPKQVADFVARSVPHPTVPSSKRVCMVTHSSYESDNRVTRYAEALATRGDHVDVFALRQSPELPKDEVLNGVHVHRIQDRFARTERSQLAYLWPLLRFFRKSSGLITRHHARNKYDFVHIHNVPDFMVFTAWYPKLTGTPVILDIHDIVPEFFASKFGLPAKGMIFTHLKWMERASAMFARHVIIANHLWLDKYSARTRTEGRCTAFINHVDSRLFYPRPRKRQDGKLIVLFPGGLQWHQGVDIALRAFKQVSAKLPHAEFHIYGDGSAKQSLVELAGELMPHGKVRFFDTLSLREIAAVMADADLGVVPKRADSFGNEAYSTKIMEFMSVNVPVIVSNTKIDRYYFNDSVVRFFESGNVESMAEAMIEVLSDSKLRQVMVERASVYVARNNWENRKPDYLKLVESLCIRN